MKYYALYYTLIYIKLLWNPIKSPLNHHQHHQTVSSWSLFTPSSTGGVWKSLGIFESTESSGRCKDTQKFTHENSWLKPEKSRLELPNMELAKSTNRHIFDAEKHEKICWTGSVALWFSWIFFDGFHYWSSERSEKRELATATTVAGKSSH